MNNQFATQFLREDLDNLPDNDLPIDIDNVVKRLMQFGLDEFEALNLAQQIVKDIKLDEDGGAAAPAGGGGSTTGGGVTNGASFTPGAGEQYAAGTKKKKKYQEDAPRLAGSPGKTTSQGAKNLSAYSSVGFTKAPSAEEAGKKMKSIDVKMLWKEGEAADWNQIQQHVMKIAKHYGYGKDYVDYMKGCYDQGLITKPTDLDTCTAGWGEALREYINESRAYSQFKKQTAIRPKNEQMHEAVKMIHKKLEEVSKLVEFAKQMRTELSEGENALEYKHNTKKIFEKINSKVVEVYTKTRDLK